MNRKLLVSALLVVCAIIASAEVARATVLVYEGFAESADNANFATGLQNTYSVGLSGPWTETLNNNASTKNRSTSYGWDAAETNMATLGLTPSLRNSTGFFNFVECGSWGLEQAVAPLATPIDMTGNGTTYMSFVSSAGTFNYAAQMGLNDGTNELMWGNGYTGGTQGLSARYGLMTDYANGGAIKGTSGISPTMTSGFDVMLYVAKLENVVGTGLNVSVYAYDLNTITSVPSASDTPLWTTTVSSPTSAFTNIEFDLSGSGMWPGIGQLRVGETWQDVAVVPEPSTIVMLVLGALGIAIYARRK